MADGATFPEIEQFSRAGGFGNPLGGALGGTTLDVDIGDLAVEIHDDGQGGQVIAVTAPAVHTHDDEDEEFDENLAEDGRIDEGTLNAIAEELLQGVEADEMTRAELIRQYQEGLELLTNKNEAPGTSQSQARSTITQINHPLLTEAMVKYHAGAIAEMLPAAGPAKVGTTGQVSSDEEEQAQDFADVLNYFLTNIATEYYPDTSQMLMHQGYCGNAYKKIYRCPMRMRPVSESVRMLDLIISDEATSVDNAIRVTHQFFPSRAELKRMMIMGRYRNFDIPYSSMQTPLGTMSIKRSEGLSPQAMRPQDVPLHIYETDMYLDPELFPDIVGKFEREAPEGLPLPYKVTVHKDTRQILGVWRNWEDGDELYMKNNMYVRYGLVPGLGFHNWGFLQLLGNQTRALRAIWRLLIDSGMFSNFPGGVKIKGARTSTNEIRPGPGEWVDIDVPGATDIRAVLMPLPYKQLDQVFTMLAQTIEDGARKLAGMVELEVGEGRTNVPVGTILSQIEQSTQMMAAVHKGNHNAQKDELLKLRKVFAKNPEDLWRLNPNPARRYETAEEFMNLNLLPASDPNLPAQMSRIMQAWALLTLVQQAPGQFDIQEVLRRALTAIRIADPKTVLLSPEQQAAAAQSMAPQAPPPDPAKMAAAQAKTQQAGMQHQAKMQEIQANAAAQQSETSTKANAAALESADRQADRQARLQEAAIRANVDREKIAADLAKASQPPPVPAGGTATVPFGG